MNSAFVIFTLLAGLASAQLDLGNHAKQWWYQSCGKLQKVQVDLLLGFGYVDASSVDVSVLIDFKTNEAAFSFKKSSRCLVVPLDTTIFSDSPGNMELKAAKFSMNGKFGTAGNSNSFKAFKVVPNSAYFDPSTHFQHDASKDKIKSDLIVETCEDMEHVATATLKPVSNSECPADNTKCIMTTKVCDGSA